MRHSEWNAHALPLNDRFFQEPFYVTHAGWERVSPHQPYPRPGHPSYYGFKWDDGRVLGEFCLSLITRGEGELQTKQGRQGLRAGDAFLFRPGEWHRHRPLPAVGWSNVWLNFNGNLPHRWLKDGSFRLDRNLIRVANQPLFEKQLCYLVESIEASNAANSLQFSWQAIGVLSHFLSDSPAAGPSQSAGSGNPVVDAAMDYIWSQSHNQIAVPDVARHTGVKRRTLERHFKAVTGSSLLNEIQRCRISRASLLLRETEVPIKYVIGRAGFASYQRLRHAFQKHFMLSPEAFREKCRADRGATDSQAAPVASLYPGLLPRGPRSDRVGIPPAQGQESRMRRTRATVPRTNRAVPNNDSVAEVSGTLTRNPRISPPG